MSKNNPDSEIRFRPETEIRNPTSAIPMSPNLAHSVYIVNNKNLCLLPQRGNVIQPKVGVKRLPWVTEP